MTPFKGKDPRLIQDEKGRRNMDMEEEGIISQKKAITFNKHDIFVAITILLQSVENGPDEQG